MEIIVPIVVGVLAALAAANAMAGEPMRPRNVRGGLGGLWEALTAAMPVRAVKSPRIQALAGAWAAALPHGRLEIKADDAGSRLALLVVSMTVCAGVGGLVSLSVLGVLWGAAVPVVMGAALAAMHARHSAHDAEEALPEAFAALSMSLGSGHSLAQGMRFVGGHAAEPVRTEFTRVSYAIECGVSAADALDDMLARVDAPGLGLVALSLKVSQRTGAPLAGLLSEAASMAGERIELKRRLDVKTSQARMSAHMVACMPLAMMAALGLLSADFRRGLATPVGAASIVVALALNAVGLAVIRKIMKVEL